ncbi:hypothetical protein DPEC_G00114080 [Dallia pectoralis]|uniref:Uncharacterized protein n=1 Tax=Dallia pectoralis TaxID=75939 RepID=A0ACC2GU88_DALPE|nr:hypothetical protein DPEC_G00114080 [Dallia pectoralis]
MSSTTVLKPIRRQDNGTHCSSLIASPLRWRGKVLLLDGERGTNGKRLSATRTEISVTHPSSSKGYLDRRNVSGKNGP